MKKRKKPSNKVNLIICAIAFVFMIFYVYFVDGGFDKIFENIRKISIGYLLLAVLFMILYWGFEALTLHAAVKQLHPRQKFYQTFIVAILGQYFNCITPSSTGGQPMQVYYFSKLGTPVAPAMTGLLGRFIVYQFSLTVYTLVVLILRFNQFATDFAPLMALVLVGFIINTAVIIFLLMIAFFKKPVIKCALVILKLIRKIKIIKTDEQYEEKKELILKIIDEYHENFKLIRSKPFLILRMLVYSVIQLTIYFSISYLIYLGFGLSEVDLFTIIACQAFVQLISGFMPLPGALGAAEGSYTAFFGSVFKNGGVGVSTFIWRFLTFYLPIILGLICSLFLGKVMKIAVPDDDELQEFSENRSGKKPDPDTPSEPASGDISV